MSGHNPNMRRINRAHKAIKDYANGLHGVAQARYEPLDQNIVDLVTDLLHLARAKGLDTTDILRRVDDHFTIETGAH